MESVKIERVRILFDYDPITGILTRACDCGRGMKGQVLTANRVWVDGTLYPITHIIWAVYYGEWPKIGCYVDHKNRIKSQNWIDNLRLATPTQNQLNKSGFGTYAKGVTWRDRKSKPWQAKIRVNGIRYHLGSFVTEEEAAEAYRQACIEHHGEFACPT